VVKNTEGNAVLIRIHPDMNTAVVDREFENKLVAWLSENSIAPLFYGRFENGRVEEFYANAVPLTIPEMHVNAEQIGRLMGRLHSLKPPAGIFSSSSKGDAWQRIENWIVAARESNAQANLLTEIERQWDWLKAAFVQQQPSKSSLFLKQTVFTHMDCQSSNLLKVNGTLKLIDFEYAGLNPRGADIANTWCEFTNMNGLCADYAAEFPSLTTQHAFLKAYIEGTGSSMIPTQSYLTELCAQVGRYTAFSHLHWAVWSLVQLSSNNQIQFDYAAYAQHRMEGYKYFKQRFWEK
jgi:thiamine kinase-like enzyme